MDNYLRDRMAHIIGIGGVSRSGKSTLAKKLKEQLSDKRVLSLDQDNFVFPEPQIPKIKDRSDWERPESVDFKRILTTIDKHKKNYDLIIVEGILAFANERLCEQYELTILMEISKKTCLERRQKETRWGYEPEWYLEHVWQSYMCYGQYKDADFVLSGENEPGTVTLNKIINRIF